MNLAEQLALGQLRESDFLVDLPIELPEVAHFLLVLLLPQDFLMLQQVVEFILFLQDALVGDLLVVF